MTSQTVLSAFDFVVGQAIAGPHSGRSTNELVRSDGAINPFDELLKEALAGTTGLAFPGINAPATAVPAVVSPATEPAAPVAAESLAPANGTSDAAIAARQYVLGGVPSPFNETIGEPLSSEMGSVSSRDDSLLGQSTQSSAIAPAVTESDDGGKLAPANIADEPATSEAAGDQNTGAQSSSVSPAQSDEEADAVLLPISTRHSQGENQTAASGTKHGRRTPRASDESERDQILPFAPAIDSTIAPGLTEIGGSQVATQSSSTSIGPNELELPAANPIQVSGGRSSENDDVRAIADEQSSAPVEADADPVSASSDVTLVAVEAAIVPGTAAISVTPPAGREEMVAEGTRGVTGESDRRGPGVRNSQARSSEESSLADSEAEIALADAPTTHPIRPLQEVASAARRTNDDDTAQDLGFSTPASASSISSDASATPEPAAAVPSVAQQVSQAVETWRDALQEQGSARFAAWLSPPGLGHVWIELTRSADGITARLKGSDDSVQSLLESQELELRQTLADSGITVAELDLSGRAAGDFASDQRHQQPDQPEIYETSTPQPAAPVVRASAPQRSSAVDVKA